MRELGDAERFVVWSFRRWVLGLRQNDGGHWDFVWHEFEKQLGTDDGKLALASFARLVGSLQCHARRPICHHQPCCACLGTDEVWLVCVVAACQLRRERLAGDLIAWIVAPEGAETLLEAGLRLGELMRGHALHVPLRVGRAPSGRHAPWAEMSAPPRFYPDAANPKGVAAAVSRATS